LVQFGSTQTGRLAHHTQNPVRLRKDFPGHISGAYEHRLVTGGIGTTGIGFAPARRFAVEGAEVFVTGRHRAELDAVVGAIGPKAIGIQADSSNLSDLNGLYERVKAEAGRIDVLFVNAGGAWRLPLGSIIEQQYEAPRQRNASLTERP
jgi:NAD(P)-dependent dehydrogenase (short-subunit alcohol dehydrogenase family)